MSIKARIAAGVLAAVSVVGVWEGRSLFAYWDPIGIPTICDGWTQGVRMGDVATPDECDQKTLLGLRQAGELFERWVPAEVIERMSPKTISAFLSFIYNVGPGAPGVKDGFVWLKSGRHSTMLRELQAGRVAAACAQLPSWDKAGGKVLRGLVRRRAAERAICEAGL